MTHHDTIVAKRAPNNGDGDTGSFSIIEDDGQFSVYEGGYCHASGCGSLEEATTAAQELAADFDADALKDLKAKWLEKPSSNIEETVGFEDVRQELLVFRLETSLAAAKKEIKRLHDIIRPFGALLNDLCGFDR
jgi:hypothetical protein